MKNLKGYAFLNVNHPIVAWATYRGVLVSANAEYSPPNCPLSLMFAGMISTQNNVRLQNELLIENHRQLNSPTKISRLTGMYFFENEETAKFAYSWGGHSTAEARTNCYKRPYMQRMETTYHD